MKKHILTGIVLLCTLLLCIIIADVLTSLSMEKAETTLFKLPATTEFLVYSIIATIISCFASAIGILDLLHELSYKTYEIYHPANGIIAHDFMTAMREYEFVGKIKARSLHDAFKMSQNEFNPDYKKFGRRSTCVGDIIGDPQTKSYLFFDGVGFKKIGSLIVPELN